MTSAPSQNVPPPRALTIAGSDPSGGAGIQADLKTFEEFGVYGMSVITALTAQNTGGVHGVHHVPPSFVSAQIGAVLEDLGAQAIKTGMLGRAGTIEAVVQAIRSIGRVPLVVDPVCVSQHGDPLLEREALDVLRDELIPLATIVTPNLSEVELLTGVTVNGIDDLRPAAQAMLALGGTWVLVKGGHLSGDAHAVDLLSNGTKYIEIARTRVPTSNTHGSGCTLAAAIAASLAHSASLEEAVGAAKDFVTGAVRNGFNLGNGIGPVDHLWRRRGPQIQAGVAAIIRDDNERILLHRRRAGGGWAPPSGTIEAGEDITSALHREVAEETGLTVEMDHLVAVYSEPDFQSVHYPDGRIVQFITTVISCRVTGGIFRGSDEGVEWGWFKPNDLPTESLPYARSWIRDAEAGSRITHLR